MSIVTGVILVTFLNDGSMDDDTYENVEALNRWLVETRGRPCDQLVRVDQHAGGGKRLQCDVWMAAFNMLDEDAFIKAVGAINWVHEDCVQLMLQGDGEDLFRVMNIDQIRSHKS